jgi:MFS family permease
VTVDSERGGARGWSVWLLAVAFVVYLFSFQTGYAIVNPSVQKDVQLSVAQVGTIAAVYTWVLAACQFFSGSLLDRLGARKVLPVCIALVTLGIFVFANAQSFGVLLLSQLIIALGACAGFVGAGYVGGQWFGMAKFSLMFGLVQFAASLFSAFGQNLLGLLLAYQPWRTVFNEIGVLGIGLFVLGALFIRDAQPPPARPGEGIGSFLGSLGRNLMAVARIRHVWIAAAFGAMCFGSMLSLGVVWGPKLMMARGLEPSTATWTASLLWLGLAAGCFAIPAWSDRLRRRKLPMVLGTLGQLLAIVLILYAPSMGAPVAMAACFLFGFANAVHMLAFSTAADVVAPDQIGTAAAIVNGTMFIMGGILISRPGVRVGAWLEAHDGQADYLALAQFASLPLLLALAAALVLALSIRETYPRDDGSGPRTITLKEAT